MTADAAAAGERSGDERSSDGESDDGAATRQAAPDRSSRARRVAASALARAAFCPRQLYYARREDDLSPPPAVAEKRALAYRYAELREADDATLRNLPVELPPADYRANLDRLAARDDWPALADPPVRGVLLTGKDCRGVAHKILPGDDADSARGDADRARDDVAVGAPDAEATNHDGGGPSPPVPTLVAAGVPPESGVWEPQAVRAVALAKMLAWERGRKVPTALVEYPLVGEVRTVRVTARRSARYRGLLRTVRTMDGPPPRIGDDAKCGACDYRRECGVKTRSLRSLFGL